MSSLITRVRVRQIEQLIEKGKRLDARGLGDYREIKVEQGVIEKAEGSARVFLGKTEVLVGVKVETGTPFPDTPNNGVLTVNAELVPLASPTFEPGPPDENSIELARIVDRGIRESEAIDTEKLCIEAGKQVFVVFVDVYVLNHDGNLIDASALAAVAALMNTKMPNYEVKDGEVVQHVDGKTMWLDIEASEEIKVDEEMKRKFKQYWTVEYENYPVFDHYVKVSDPITVKASV